MDKAQAIYIRTPEGITFSLLPAGPLARFLAWAVDLSCILVIWFAINTVIRLFTIVSIDLTRAITIISYFSLSIGYGIFCEWRFKGQTPGKRLIRLRVMDVQGLRLHHSQIIIRNLLRFIDILPVCYLAGGLSCLLSPKSQRLGDLAANTVVIREPRISRPDLEQIQAYKYNSLLDHPRLVARLRQRISPRQAHAALQALIRRDQLDSLSRIELFTQIALYFRGAISFPQDTTEGITDEQFVRNVVSALFMPSPVHQSMRKGSQVLLDAAHKKDAPDDNEDNQK